MPTCQNCKKKWTWSETIKRSFTFRKGMRCTHCGKKQYHTQASMWKMNMIGIIPLIFLPIIIMFDTSIVSTIIIFLTVLCTYTCILPFFLELSNKEQPLW